MQVVDPDAAALNLTRGKPLVWRDRSQSEFPRHPPRRRELRTNPHLWRAVFGDETEPKVVLAGTSTIFSNRSASKLMRKW